MVLKSNSFRSNTYFRSAFEQGRFLLSSEASELQQETTQLIQNVLQAHFGKDFALEDSWKPTISSDTLTLTTSKKQDGSTITDRPAEAFFNNVPFVLGVDNSGLLVNGSVPTGVSTGSGANNLVFTGATPSDTYAIVISVEEQRVTGASSGQGGGTPSTIKDPFLRNQDIGTNTGEKRRLIYKINIVLNSETTSLQDYPLSTSQTFVDEITLIETTNYTVSAGPTTVSGNNGEDFFVDLQFTAGPGTPDKVPRGQGREEFILGTLIDQVGTEFTITDIFDSPASADSVRYTLDAPRNQSDGSNITPILNTSSDPTILKKRSIFTTDLNEIPVGTVYWKLGTVVWNGVSLASLVDLRNEISLRSWNFDRNLELTDGGTVSWDLASSDQFVWGSTLRIRNPIGTADWTIAASNIVLSSSGDMAYVNLDETISGITATRPDGGLLTMQTASVNVLPSGENVFVVAWRGDDGRLYIRGHGSLASNQSSLLGESSMGMATFQDIYDDDVSDASFNLDTSGFFRVRDNAGNNIISVDESTDSIKYSANGTEYLEIRDNGPFTELVSKGQVFLLTTTGVGTSELLLDAGVLNGLVTIRNQGSNASLMLRGSGNVQSSFLRLDVDRAVFGRVDIDDIKVAYGEFAGGNGHQIEIRASAKNSGQRAQLVFGTNAGVPKTGLISSIVDDTATERTLVELAPEATATFTRAGSKFISMIDDTSTERFAVKRTGGVIGVSSELPITSVKRANDAAPGDVTLETIIYSARNAETMLSVKFLPSESLTADNTNNATLTVYRRDASGGTQTTIATVTTSVGGTGDWTAFDVIDFGSLSATSLAANEVLTIEITKAGSGVAVPRGTWQIERQID